MNDTPNNTTEKILVFALDEPRYALYLSIIERVVAAVEITPLPKAPVIVMGAINFHGKIIPVIDMRTRFKLPVRAIEPEDQFIIARTSNRSVALAVDSVVGIRDCTEIRIVESEEAFPFAGYLSGMAIIDDNLVLISDLDQFLSLDEEKILDDALLEMPEETTKEIVNEL